MSLQNIAQALAAVMHVMQSTITQTLVDYPASGAHFANES